MAFSFAPEECATPSRDEVYEKDESGSLVVVWEDAGTNIEGGSVFIRSGTTMARN
jgi:hypothetical protein